MPVDATITGARLQLTEAVANADTLAFVLADRADGSAHAARWLLRSARCSRFVLVLVAVGSPGTSTLTPPLAALEAEAAFILHAAAPIDGDLDTALEVCALEAELIDLIASGAKGSLPKPGHMLVTAHTRQR